MLRTALGRFRLIAVLEGASYLLLLGVAMPLKYIFDMPTMVSVVGMAHGWLFILYVLLGAHAAVERRWTAGFTALAFFASLLPFATFYLDYYLRKQVQAEAQAAHQGTDGSAG